MINNWQEAGLLKPSAIKPAISTIEQTLVLKKLGKLSQRFSFIGKCFNRIFRFKKNEVKREFLMWFEREIGSEIYNLANKTAIKEYHEHDFNQLLEVLRKNSNKRLDNFARLQYYDHNSSQP